MPTDYSAAAKDAATTLAANLTALGKSELADAALRMEEFAPAAARWEAGRLQAKAAGDDAKLDQLDRDFDVLAADAVERLADAGVLTQSEGEKFAGTLLSLAGKLTLAAVVAA
jgi:hypothetical protein